MRLSLNSGLAWLLIAMLGVADFIGLQTGGMKFVAHDFVLNMIAVTVLLSISFIYAHIRHSPRIAELSHMAAVFLSFAAVSAIACYLAVAWQRPLIDDYLVAADRFLGLDWVASYKWITARPLLYKVLYFAYSTIILQIIFLLLYLNSRGRCGRAWEVVWLFMVSCVICLAFSAIWPAAGAFGHFNIEADRPYVHVFMGLHEGTIRAIGDSRVEGIIQFPSFHMAQGILLTYATRGIRIVFPAFLGLNILLIISTPAVGGHHYADLWGGAVLALITIWIVRKAFAAGLVPSPDKISSM